MRALRTGPPYRPSHRKIIIDITTACDLHCIDCDRSCGQGQATSDEHMSISQIQKFIGESVEQSRKWSAIILEGGEPTLHPELEKILKTLISYRQDYSPHTDIRVMTNGYGKTAKEALPSLSRKGISIFSSKKKSVVQQHHCAFNVAPCDVPEFENMNFSGGCYLPVCYGLGLTRYGYYPHPICGGIDRVFGFDIGRKTLPPSNDTMADQYARLCSFCGFFRYSLSLRGKGAERAADYARGAISSTWQQAYFRYWQEKPKLKEY